MVSAENILRYPYWKITFIVHNRASDKQVGDVIIHNNKLIAIFSISLRKLQYNYIIIKR